MKEPIPETQRQASRMYNSFYESMILPGIFGKEAVLLFIAQIEYDLHVYRDDFDATEIAAYQNYINYVKSQEVIKRSNEHTR